jgi:light-regulated signal transduction histidine kinase (bacteriophytochrome)
LTSMAKKIAAWLSKSEPGRNVSFSIEEGLVAQGDEGLLRIALENLLGNAWKFTSKQDKPLIEFGKKEGDDKAVFYVRDNGIGFSMAYAHRLFIPFQRLHDGREFDGEGIGLATVKRIISRHGGKVWAEAEPKSGAVFYFTLE